MKRMKDLPKIKKSVKNFLTNEDGKITKESVMKVGSILLFSGILATKAGKAYDSKFGYGKCSSDDDDPSGVCRDTMDIVHTSKISLRVTDPDIYNLFFTHTNAFQFAHDNHSSN